MRSHGFELELKTAQQCLELEPALRYSRIAFAGGIYSPTDESGDAHQFSRRLEELCRLRGVRFLFQTTVQRLLPERGALAGAHIRHVEGTEQLLRADAYLVCLGSYTPLLVAPLGVRVPVYPVKGYSITAPVKDFEAAPRVCLTDEGEKLAISRLGDRLRVAGTAELGGYDTCVNAVRCKAILQRAEQLLPSAADYLHAQPWTGLRPATPGNVPIIGRTRLPNLFVNTGHGTLGWTMACGSGKAIASIISGRTPAVDFAFLGV